MIKKAQFYWCLRAHRLRKVLGWFSWQTGSIVGTTVYCGSWDRAVYTACADGPYPTRRSTRSVHSRDAGGGSPRCRRFRAYSNTSFSSVSDRGSSFGDDCPSNGFEAELPIREKWCLIQVCLRILCRVDCLNLFCACNKRQYWNCDLFAHVPSAASAISICFRHYVEGADTTEQRI